MSGTVISSDDKYPIAGATVFIQGKDTGTMTDFDGVYQISVITGDKITFSYLGFDSQTITITNQNKIDITLIVNTALLDEIVVIGYGSQRKKEVTGAVSVLDSKTIERLNPTRVEQALQGQVSGVNVTSGSGSPGSEMNIRIRGVSTNGDNRPLILVDGNPIEDLSVINPNDIKSINILKDATAGIYGVRAANGVILIVTKSGRKNAELKLNLDTFYGFQQTSKKLNLFDFRAYPAYINESYDNALSHPLFSAGGEDPMFVSIPKTGTDWQNEVFDLAPILSLSLGATGGTKKSAYSFGVSYLDQDGVVGLDKSKYNRLTARATFDYDVTEKLKINTTILYTLSNKNYLQEGNVGSVLYNAINIAPNQLVYDSTIQGGYTQADGMGNEISNPIAQLANSFDKGQTNKISPQGRIILFLCLNYLFN
ncbi:MULTISPECIES: TonB-dependent receptor plug domain-containing protein [unclassified Polaribacter]|uniref:TonB-dependent receptor plug domain-containing protein n=1 Tax=unclassified Polaribacter TaxID=196858 RepID=UPI001676C686|nr:MULTISPECIES: TonB-dependent receptor plug domain-containing protein [unclassified Polaribacter]